MPVQYLKESPSQTAGPFLHIGMLPAVAGLNMRTQEKLHVLTTPGTEGEHIRIEGTVYDGSGAPVKDAAIEIWQANAKGVYNAPGFTGWGRVACSFEDASYFFETVKPGATPWIDGRPQAPHISVLVFARGINIHLHTRLYFSDEEAANTKDPVLMSVEQANLRPTLIAKKSSKGGQTVYTFDIHLQGDKETVFFDF